MSGYLELWRLTKTFPGPAGPATVVKNFSLSLNEGEFVTLIGHSGCGKSTVLSMVAGLSSLSGGGIILGESEVVGPGTDRGVVFQSPCLLPWLTAIENVILGVRQVQPDSKKREQAAVAERNLRLVGLGDALHRKPGELSAGMRQRVGIARAFALAPRLLLLDEPFGMLDSLTRIELQEVLLDLWQEDRKTALMVTHDVEEAIFLSDRVVMMTSGPEATVGGEVTVPFPRPRGRRAVLEHPDHDPLRDEILSFLSAEEKTNDAVLEEAGDREAAPRSGWTTLLAALRRPLYSSPHCSPPEGAGVPRP
ncbi:MAG TPA: ABC transporter ATP-binding protein [Planctomycetota bacterium]|nr:ABC transporter ATP-binding protein [Planctomycetota bacterium]